MWMRCYYIKDPLEEESLQSYEPKLKDFWKKNSIQGTWSTSQSPNQGPETVVENNFICFKISIHPYLTKIIFSLFLMSISLFIFLGWGMRVWVLCIWFQVHRNLSDMMRWYTYCFLSLTFTLKRMMSQSRQLIFFLFYPPLVQKLCPSTWRCYELPVIY